MDGLGIQVTLGQPDVSRARMVARCLTCWFGARPWLRRSSRAGRPGAPARGRSNAEERRRVEQGRGDAAGFDRRTPSLRWRGAGGRGSRRRWPAGRLRRTRRRRAARSRPTPTSARATCALARPNRPITLPIYRDNRAIPSGLPHEKGPLQFYNWIDYINPDVITSFQKKYGVKVEISTFTTIDEAVAKLASGAVQFDVFVPETVFLEQLVVGKILQPLNHSYIPNLAANVWPSLADPWYDVGSRYSVPYTVYTTGIGWRSDFPSRLRSRPAGASRGARGGARARGSRARSACSTTSTTA